MLLTDIRKLYVVPRGPVAGPRMRDVPVIDDAALLIENGRVAWFGPQGDAPYKPDLPRHSAGGGCVIPGLIDCHTHIPFAGDRCGEFVRRLGGESYLAILQAGGGIRVTTAAVRAASELDLIDENLPRLRRMLADGVTTAECKSGYGLSPDHELKQLRATRQLASQQPIELVATYLGAHAVPHEFDGRADAFIDAIGSDALLRQIADEKLAEFCDVFCDRGAFDTAQSRRLLERARAAGLKLKLHADELAQIGASRLAGELRAVSADHLEVIDDGGIDAMLAGGTVAVALPGTSFFLGIHHCDARRMLNRGLPLAIGTDLNPGSCHIESLPLVMNIACCQLRLMPIEVLVACTANAAAAIAAQDRIGAIEVGMQADLTIVAASSVDAWMYQPGRRLVSTVIKRGEVVLRMQNAE
ncbi:MAG: imidazolonepropionase [Phycisphaerae bacterium]